MLGASWNWSQFHDDPVLDGRMDEKYFLLGPIQLTTRHLVCLFNKAKGKVCKFHKWLLLRMYLLNPTIYHAVTTPIHNRFNT